MLLFRSILCFGVFMARLHTKKKGKSSSRKTRSPAKWVETSPEEVEKMIINLRKAGNSAAQIGVILRDQHGIPSVRNLCKKPVMQIIEEKTGKVAYPDDLLNLIKKAVNLRKHLDKHKSDVHNKAKLHSIESKIRRAGRYYSRTGKLAANWVYDPEKAALLVR